MKSWKSLGCLNFLGTHTAAVVEFKIKRRLQHFIVGFYVPCIACTVASWIQFWMDEMAVGDRASLGITSVLTEIFLLEFSNQGMPKVSYMKVAELYLIVSFVFIFLALIESAVVYKVSQWSLLKKNSGKMTEKEASRDKVIWPNGRSRVWGVWLTPGVGGSRTDSYFGRSLFNSYPFSSFIRSFVASSSFQILCNINLFFNLFSSIYTVSNANRDTSL